MLKIKLLVVSFALSNAIRLNDGEHAVKNYTDANLNQKYGLGPVALSSHKSPSKSNTLAQVEC